MSDNTRQAGSTPARYFLDYEDDFICPNCGAVLVQKSSIAIGVMFVCGCGKSYFPEELEKHFWPNNDGVLL